jgi:hypothetical protein
MPVWLIVILIVLALFVLGPIALMTFVCLAVLPRKLELTPADDRALRVHAVDCISDFEACGFEPLGPVLEDNSPLNTLILPLVNRSLPAFGVVYYLAQAKHRVSCEVATVFEDDDHGLTSGSSPDAGVTPVQPGDFLQFFPHVDVATLVEQHRNAWQWLEGYGVRPGRHDDLDSFKLGLARSIREGRAYLLRRPHLMLLLFWRIVTRHSPYRRPVSEQPGAQRYVLQR